MKVNKKYKGLVTKKFNEFYLVELDKDETSVINKKFLCKIKKSVNFRNQFVFVGDEVIVHQIDLQSKRATIESLVKRNNLLERPSVANISNIYVICSVEEPKLNLSQVNKFLISSEQLGVEVSLVLTKCDLITEEKRLLLIEKFKQFKINKFYLTTHFKSRIIEAYLKETYLAPFVKIIYEKICEKLKKNIMRMMKIINLKMEIKFQ